MIKVYYHHFKQAPSLQKMKELAAVLPPSFHQNIFKFFKDDDKYTALLGKLMLQQLLKEHGFHPDKLSELQTDYYGKPTIPNVPAFNISHTKGFVVCAWASDQENVLGIDVEGIQPIDKEAFKSCFNKKEWRLIIGDDAYHEFYKYWTMKESFIKADGRGLSLEPIRVITDGMQAYELGKSEQWHFYPLDLHPDYYIHLCLDHKDAKVNCLPFTP